MSAKKINIDWDKVGRFLQAQCSGSGIAGLLGIHENTLYSRCKTDNGMEFMAFAEQKKCEGKELLKAKQFETAMGGSIPMQIWLGKQYLGQRDQSQTEYTGIPETININVSSKENADKLKKFLSNASKLN
jgi:hypothetical protein